MGELPNKRVSEILDILLNAEVPITVDVLAKKLNVSNRTIRNDLQILQEYVIHSKCGTLFKKPRIGVWLETSLEEESHLKEIISKRSLYIKPLSSEKRKLHIIRKLLQSEDNITIQKLAHELQVSRVTVYKDLKDVKKWLSVYDLSLLNEKGSGIEISGSERNWRRAVVDHLSIIKDNLELKNMLLKLDDNNFRSTVEQENYSQLKELFPNTNVKAIELILNEARNKMELKVSPEIIEGLLVHISIAIERLKKQKNIKMAKGQLSMIQKQKEYETAKFIARRIGMEFEVVIPDSEVGYIALHLSGPKVFQEYESVDNKKILDNAEDRVLILAKEIISLVGSILSVNLEKDERLLVGLVLHLRPTINRLKYGLGVKNPMLKNIKNNYPSIFGASWASSVLFEKHLGIKVNEDEIGYIAAHIGAALRRLEP